MHDFIQSQSFSTTRHPPAAVRFVVPEWVQLGLMRSFGDDVVAPYRPSPKSPDHPDRTAKRAPRSAILSANR